MTRIERTSAVTRAAFLPALFLLAPALLHGQLSTRMQQPISSPSTMPVPPGVPTFSSAGPVTPEQERMQRMMRQRQQEERFRKIQADAQKLVRLSERLAAMEQEAAEPRAKAEEERDRLAAEIEKLSRSVHDLEVIN